MSATASSRMRLRLKPSASKTVHVSGLGKCDRSSRSRSRLHTSVDVDRLGKTADTAAGSVLGIGCRLPALNLGIDQPCYPCARCAAVNRSVVVQLIDLVGTYPTRNAFGKC